MKSKYTSDERELVASLFRSFLQIALFFLFPSILEISWIAVSLLVALQTVLMIQTVLFFHDCMHGSAFRKNTLNTLAGRTIGALFFWPFSFLRASHLSHHRRVGLVLGDPEHLHPTREQVQRKPIKKLLCYLAKTPLAPVFYPMILQFSDFIKFLFGKNEFNIERKTAIRTTIQDAGLTLVFWTLLNGGFYLIQGQSYSMGVPSFFVSIVLPMVLAMAAVYLASKPLHTGMHPGPLENKTYAERVFLTTRTIDSNKWIRRLFCNLNFHVEHHLYPTTSRKNLAMIAALHREELILKSKSLGVHFVAHRAYWDYYKNILNQPIYNQYQRNP